MTEQKREPNETNDDKAVPDFNASVVDSATERETEERERMRRKEEQKHHEQAGS